MSSNSSPGNLAIEQFLDNLFHRADCPTSDQLLDYDLNILASDERSQLKQHMNLCPSCQQELSQLRAIDSEPVTMPASKPQPTLLDSIQAWLRQLVPDKPIIPAILEPSTLIPAMALRGTADCSQQYIYSSDSYRLSLHVTPGIAAQTAAQINGHIMNQNDLDEHYIGIVHLIQEQIKRQETVLDEFGFFTLEKVEIGSYTLLLELDAHTIWVDNMIVS